MLQIVNFPFPLRPPPTPAACAGLEARRGDDLFFASGDIDNCFYRMKAPAAALPFFTLPSIRAKFVGVITIDRKFVDGDTLITPRLTVLPMGWNWSLWLGQMVHEMCADEMD